MNIITGYRGEPHITSAQDRAQNQGTFGTGAYILNVGEQLSTQIVSANEIRVRDGVLCMQGCVANIESGAYDICEISNGTQGMQRKDLIVARYTRDAETNVEDISLVVIEGTPASSSPSDPEYNTGNIQAGDSPVDFPLYRVNISGITISSTTKLASNVRTQAEADTLIGSTALPTIAQTITGAIAEHESDIGNTALPTTAQTITGAIAEHEGDISTLTSYGIANPITDANNATEIGKLYSANNTAANTPSSAYWVLWNRSYSATYSIQFAQIVNTKTPMIYARSTDGSNSWGDWKKIADTRPVTITAASGITNTPSVRQGNGIATIEFALQIPAKTYAEGATIWTVTPAPSGVIHFIAFVGSEARLFRLSSTGTIVANNAFTLNNSAYMIGHVTYPFA